ncbi:hypothetical protein D7V94_13415 [Parablautia intestinalis]|uniref:Phage protein Gp138 N-terminal domain-containing protein n=1 Tax=Parablautia intestinalis TaxID=2320100 RepID=A0A3A9AGM6_9FIRM|nr:Gp138 family membrane-puncturing spike protein [Parablautia intestinalis]RKI90428.1 hypothetical protein D7V94_13415 [Parablautia intestinalis]
MIQEFVQQIEDTVREATYDIHTALPGTITEFDVAAGMASVKPEGTMTMKNGMQLTYPTIVKVPVVFPQACGQKTTIAYPVKPGDGCIILICENDLKPWMSHGKETDSNMKFDLTNAVCIPGLFGEGSEAVQKAVEEEAIVLKNEEMELILKKDGMKAQYQGSLLQMGEDAVKQECAGCSISVSGDGVVIEGNLNVHGAVTSEGG